MVELLFYLMAVGAILTGVGVVVARSPVASVVSLLGTFFCLSVVYLLAGYQFLAAIQILVYGGAVMVLFLFVVMLLNLGDVNVVSGGDEPLFHQSSRAVTGLALAAVVGAAGLVAIVAGARRLAEPAGGYVIPEDGLDPLNGLAAAMFTRYSLPFEAASVLLLATAVGVLVIAKRQRAETPRQMAEATLTPPTPPAPSTGGVQAEPEEVMS